MGYRIESHHGGGGPRKEIANFLAAFVREGHLAAPKPGDDDPAKWRQRFDWWWTENPSCGEDDLTALVLRTEDGGIAGFAGFIPVAYERDGEPVPSLVSTTFFVARAHREASMGLVARLRGVGRRCQVIDGSPSAEMVRILKRLGYEYAGDRRQYFFPARIPWKGLLASAFRLASLGPGPRIDSLWEDARLVAHPGEISRIPMRRDGYLRRAIRTETLAWMLGSGSEPRRFAALLGPGGDLLAFGLFFAKKRGGLAWAVLGDYADFTPAGTGLPALIARVCGQPALCGLDPKTRFIAWSLFRDEKLSGLRGLRRRSALYIQRPLAWQDCSREFRPVEGDLALL